MVERVKTRAEKLRDLQRQRSVSPVEEQSAHAEGRGQAGVDPFGKMPLLKRLMENPDLQETLLAWLMQHRRGRKAHVEQRASSEVAGGTEFGFGHLQRREEWATSSSLEEITHYCKQLEHRADWLEATLTETLMELERIEQIRQAIIANGARADS